jgi:hypothetical protein
MPAIEAIAPYNSQIDALSAQIGAIIARQGMKDRSGATVMVSLCRRKQHLSRRCGMSVKYRTATYASQQTDLRRSWIYA